MYLIGMDSAPIRRDNPRLDEPRYLLGQVAHAAGISANLLKSWIDREIIVLGRHDRTAHGKGSSRVFTLRRVLAVAVAAELVSMGMPAADAGYSGQGIVDAMLGSPGKIVLVDEGFWIVHRHKRFAITTGKPTNTIPEIFEKLPFLGDDDTPASIIIISMGKIAKRVLKRLNELKLSEVELHE